MHSNIALKTRDLRLDTKRKIRNMQLYTTHTIMGYDVFKYKDVYLTTEDLYAN